MSTFKCLEFSKINYRLILSTFSISLLLQNQIVFASEKKIFENKETDNTNSQLPSEKTPFKDHFAPEDQSDLNAISRHLLRKEIELLKLNTRYRIESTKTGKWKPWRLAAYGLAGNICSNIGIDHVAYARWKYWQRPSLATKAFLRKGPQMLLIGHSIIVSGVLIESTLDLINDHKIKNAGFDKKTCRNRVIALRNEIDSLQNLRDSLIQNGSYTEKEKNLLLTESQVIKDIRNSALSEYCKFSVRASKFKTSRNVANLVTFAGATTGGYMGALGNLLAVTNRKPRLAVLAGTGFILSGSFIALTPILARVSSNIVGKIENKKETNFLMTKDTVNLTTPANFDKDRLTLANLIEQNSSEKISDSVKERFRIYEKQDEILDKMSELGKREAKLAKREFMEKTISSAIVGGTKMAWGTQLIIAGSDFSNTAPKSITTSVRFGGRIFRAPVKTAKTPAQMFSKRVAQGATTFIPGTSVAIFDVLQSRIRGEIREHKWKNEGIAPGQILKQRLKILEDLEQKV